MVITHMYATAHGTYKLTHSYTQTDTKTEREATVTLRNTHTCNQEVIEVMVTHRNT